MSQAMSQEIRLIGTFPDEECCAHGIEELKQASAEWFAYSPIPSQEIATATGARPSHVRTFSLICGIGAALLALAITIGTSVEWNIIAGGKPIVSLPAFLVVTFELMCLGGAAGGVLGFFLLNGMPAFDLKPGYLPSFSGDRFGLIVQCAEADSERFESLLRTAGADEVTREAA
jgi:Alternative complex III, ActD subunit